MSEGLRISVAEAKHQVDAGAALMLDVVAPGVWEQVDVAVPGAVRIPPDQVADRVGELPHERTIIAYCT